MISKNYYKFSFLKKTYKSQILLLTGKIIQEKALTYKVLFVDNYNRNLFLEIY